MGWACLSTCFILDTKSYLHSLHPGYRITLLTKYFLAIRFFSRLHSVNKLKINLSCYTWKARARVYWWVHGHQVQIFACSSEQRVCDVCGEDLMLGVIFRVRVSTDWQSRRSDVITIRPRLLRHCFVKGDAVVHLCQRCILCVCCSMHQFSQESVFSCFLAF